MKKLSYSPRPATEDDLTQIRALEEKSMLKPWSFISLQEELKNTETLFWVVTDDETDEEIFAYVILKKSLDEAHLLSIQVKDIYRKQGIAEWLVRKLIVVCEKDEISSIFLEVSVENISAIRLYQKLGFIILRTIKNFYPGNTNAYAMVYKMKQVKIESSKMNGENFERKDFN